MAGSIPADAGSDAEIVELLHTVQRRLRSAARAELEPLGLTPAQLRALRTIGYSPEPMRMSAVADRLGVARRSATTFVDQLVDAGLVQRSADSNDRRGVAVATTAAGRKLLATVKVRRAAVAGSLLGALSPAERRQLADLLRRMASDPPSASSPEGPA
ncbi:MarR family winged helix-turn-helix transcriptional regulator [Desertimonas flava]|uniref:MarR family winged helix-turn-helix transcriptional regulator n=1 Tax=Desertimonas flava TaxID=2064846 RepID=UPI000E347CED|nr:MarR family transcriptional regulator [Desertimonas flava]